MFFLAKLSIFTLPLALFVGGFTGTMVYTGEATPLRVVVATQAGDEPVLYRPAYGNRDEQFKRLAVDTYEPDVVVLGSSRVLQMRSQLLSETPDAFYNAAAPAWRLDELENFVNGITHHPDILILGLDPPMFNANYEGDPIVEPPMNDFERLWVANRTIMQETLNGTEFDWETLLVRDEPGGSGGIALGFRAIRDGHGFRNDGSEQYGDFLVAQHLWQPNMRGLHMGLLADGEQMYAPADAVDPERFAQFVDIIDTLQARDIQVVAFMPAYMPSLWDEMIVDERYDYLRELLPRLETFFAERGIPYFDFSDGAVLGATDEDFFDGWHMSERISTQAYINMARAVPELAAYSDLDRLQEIVNTAPDTFRVFPFTAQ